MRNTLLRQLIRNKYPLQGMLCLARSSLARARERASRRTQHFTEITFNTRTADPRTTHTLSQQPSGPVGLPPNPVRRRPL